MLAAVGGVAGVALGALVTAGYANSQGWTTVVPAIALGGGVAAALAIGAVAGCIRRCGRRGCAPADALRTV